MENLIGNRLCNCKLNDNSDRTRVKKCEGHAEIAFESTQHVDNNENNRNEDSSNENRGLKINRHEIVEMWVVLTHRQND